MTRINPNLRKPPPAPAPKPKRKPMRRVSKQRAKLMRDVSPARKSYIQEIGYCEVCWVLDERFVNQDLCVHEIARGPARKAALEVRAAQLVVCSGCNLGRLNDYRECPIVLQLAIKLYSDSENFDLAAVNELRGRAPGAITLGEVLGFFKIDQEKVEELRLRANGYCCLDTIDTPLAG